MISILIYIFLFQVNHAAVVEQSESSLTFSLVDAEFFLYFVPSFEKEGHNQKYLLLSITYAKVVTLLVLHQLFSLNYIAVPIISQSSKTENFEKVVSLFCSVVCFQYRIFDPNTEIFSLAVVVLISFPSVLCSAHSHVQKYLPNM